MFFFGIRWSWNKHTSSTIKRLSRENGKLDSLKLVLVFLCDGFCSVWTLKTWGLNQMASEVLV